MTLAGTASIGTRLMDSARTISRGEPGWPERLSAIPDPPGSLRVRGDIGPADERRVAIVGSRQADPYGVEIASRLARDLSRAGVCVVSGGAQGVDAAAHLAALEAGGRTIAVLGTGVDVVYPAAHKGLFSRIVGQGGALLSELEDGTTAKRWAFPRRNRIVSGMSEAVVVVRAGARSGALITAGWARQQGVPVFAVPGDVREEGSAGPLALLRAGAKLAVTADDVLELLGMSGQLSLAIETPSQVPELERDEALVFDLLRRAPRHANELAREAQVTPGAALSILLMLELRGLCEQRPGQYFLRRA